MEPSFLSVYLSPFLCAETTFAFLHSKENFPFSRHDLNINSSGLQ